MLRCALIGVELTLQPAHAVARSCPALVEQCDLLTQRLLRLRGALELDVTRVGCVNRCFASAAAGSALRRRCHGRRSWSAAAPLLLLRSFFPLLLGEQGGMRNDLAQRCFDAIDLCLHARAAIHPLSFGVLTRGNPR